MLLSEIKEHAKRLTTEERRELMLFLVESISSPHDILEFHGIAHNISDDEDPQEYVNRLREEWDERP